MKLLVDWVLNHPSLLLLAVPAIPSILGRLEKAAIARLLSAGDEADQNLMRSVVSAVVVWAEEKGAKSGAEKFAAADKVLARALPFLSADQRKDLIENAVKALDESAKQAVSESAPPPEAHQ
jgi:hypothetical protein